MIAYAPILAAARPKDHHTGTMSGVPRSKSEPGVLDETLPPDIKKSETQESSSSTISDFSPLDTLHTPSFSEDSSTPSLSRTTSFSNGHGQQEDWELFPPHEKLTIFDFLDNLSLPTKLERWQTAINAQTEKVLRQREKLKVSSQTARDRVVKEWQRRKLTPDEQLEKYRKRMNESVDRLGRRWTATAAVTAREKLSFIAGVLNVFISGYLIGALPQYFYYWYAVQLSYFFPIRYYTYHKKGYHYFLADLCYFVNFLAVLSIFVFPQSKRLFIATYCLAYGNNAVAIAMWRNSMVFHSLDKVTR